VHDLRSRLAELWTLGAGYAYAFVSARRVLASGCLHAVGEALFKQLPGRALRSDFDFRRALAGDLTTNLWVGVAKAGYTLTEEFPIFLFIFCVPTVAAIFLKGGFSSSWL